MKTTLVLPQLIAEELLASSLERLETAGVLLVSVVPCGKGEVRLLARSMEWVAAEAYAERKKIPFPFCRKDMSTHWEKRKK